MSFVRHRRNHDPVVTFPPTIEPGELAINTANRQITAGDSDPSSLGVPMAVLAVRIFDARGKYAIGDYVVQGGYLYRCKVAHGPAAFVATSFEQIAGVDATATTLGNYLMLTGGTLSGALQLPAAAPIAATQATNKKYVDDQITGLILGQVSASTINNTPSGNISSTTVQAALSELDTEKVAKAGDSMTGQLALPATPASGPANAARRDYVDSVRTDFGAADGTLQTNIDGKVAKAGDTLTGQLSLPTVPAPVAANAVRKDYVDTLLVPATAAEFTSNASAVKMLTPATVWSAAGLVSLTGNAVQPDFGAGIDFYWPLNASCTLYNPLRMKVGQKGMIYFGVAGPGCNVGAWDSAWKFPGSLKPVFSANGGFDAMSYAVVNSSFICCFFGAGMG